MDPHGSPRRPQRFHHLLDLFRHKVLRLLSQGSLRMRTPTADVVLKHSCHEHGIFSSCGYRESLRHHTSDCAAPNCSQTLCRKDNRGASWLTRDSPPSPSLTPKFTTTSGLEDKCLCSEGEYTKAPESGNPESSPSSQVQDSNPQVPLVAPSERPPQPSPDAGEAQDDNGLAPISLGPPTLLISAFQG